MVKRETIHDLVSAIDTNPSTFPADVNLVHDAKSDWWTYLASPHTRAATTPVSQPQPAPGKSRHAESDNEMDIDDEEFQRQATPPNLMRNRESRQDQPVAAVNAKVAANGKDADDETTEDEDDVDAQPKSSTQKQRVEADLALVAPTPKPKKLGKLGGFRSNVKEPRGMQEDQSTTELASKPSTGQGTTSAEPASLPGAPKAKLGRIGARRAPSETPEPTSSVPSVSTQPSPRKLGKIGSRKTARESSATPTAQTPVPELANDAEQALIAEPIKEETEEERAKRRREELKRSLEAKSSAPAKKKRKF